MNIYTFFSGKVAIFKELVKKEGVNIKITNGEGKTAEQLAR